jgi:hypothetical protein
MPNKDCHLAVARRNQAVIDQFLANGNTHPEWVAIVAFYKALHIVDAVLFANHSDKHGGSHDNRNQILKTTTRYQNLYRHYRPLFSASLVGRYLETDQQQFRCFDDYLSAADVVSILLDHHLRQLEKSAEKIIGSLAPPASPPPTAASGPPPKPKKVWAHTQKGIMQLRRNMV